MDSQTGGTVRASDAEREAIVARLTEATSEGRLNLEEFGERVERALAARTRGDLDLVVDDLPASTALVPRPVAGSVAAAATSYVVPIGAVKRRGWWRIDRDVKFGAVIGAVKLDLRQAEIAAAEITMHVETVLGSVKIWVPRGVTVEVSGDTVIGSRMVDQERPVPGAPVLRLHVDTVLGSVKVYRV